MDGANSVLEILASAERTYFRDTTALSSSGGGYLQPYTAAENAMQLSASIEVIAAAEFAKAYDANGNLTESIDGGDNAYKLLIQPKWESPVLDFKDSVPTLPLFGSGSVARGMWHQYGQIPTNKSITLEIQDLDESELIDKTLTGSLARQLGFGLTQNNSTNIGQIASSKKISEAIVAIPFKINDVFGVPAPAPYKISKSTITSVINELDKLNITNDEILNNLPKVDPTIIEMVRKMKKYVIPPNYDFVHNDAVDPYAMFIFDFEYTLNQTDLSNIWQNLSPDIGRTAEQLSVRLPANVFSERLTQQGLTPQAPGQKTELLSSFSENTRWIVFKAKQRGVNKISTKKATASANKFMPGVGQSPDQKFEEVYSYNWPYDFFSLIELAKIDASITSIVKPGVEINPGVNPSEDN